MCAFKCCEIENDFVLFKLVAPCIEGEKMPRAEQDDDPTDELWEPHRDSSRRKQRSPRQKRGRGRPRKSTKAVEAVEPAETPKMKESEIPSTRRVTRRSQFKLEQVNFVFLFC